MPPRRSASAYVLDVVPSGDLLARAMELANTIAAGSPHSLGLIKSLVHEGLTAPVAEHMQRHTTALAACFRATITARASHRSSSAAPRCSPAPDRIGGDHPAMSHGRVSGLSLIAWRCGLQM